MHTLTFGELTFVAESTGVAVVVGVQPEIRVRLSSGDATQLQEFLGCHAHGNRRVGFRVPVTSMADRLQAAFQVRLGTGTGAVAVRPVDISLTGILVGGLDVEPREGTRIAVHMSLDGLSCRVTGSVVRCDDGLVALHFLESLRNGELSPPEALLAVYRALETEWLRSRRND